MVEKKNNQRIEVEEFKKSWKELHKGFPKYLYSEKLEEIIPTEEVRKNLIKHGFLIKCIPLVDKNGKKLPYMLGPNSLSLVSAWNAEELSKITVRIAKQTRNLSWAVIVLTIISMALSGTAIYLSLV